MSPMAGLGPSNSFSLRCLRVPCKIQTSVCLSSLPTKQSSNIPDWHALLDLVLAKHSRSFPWSLHSSCCMPYNPATQRCTAHKSTLLFSFEPLYVRALCPRKPFLGLCTRRTPTQRPSAELTASFLCHSQALWGLLSSPFHNLSPCFAVCT